MANALIGLLNGIFDGIGTIITAILSILPDSPFNSVYSMGLDFTWFKYFNWFLPLSEMLTVMAAWLSAILLYYGLSIIMRWIKAIE